jgi:murein L,D-transpeptidase YafK
MRQALAAAGALLIVAGQAAEALTIELKDVAADRVERQRRAAAGMLPLPGTPNIAEFGERLTEKGLTLRSPILIRIFKAESELEIWKEKDGSFIKFATYPICHWSGSLGPKLRDGDKQAPEGFYAVNRAMSRHVGRWPRSLNIGFPNIYDQSLARTGSDILIHGGCSSIGCFAMTNPVMDEIYQLTESALDGGQEYIPIHSYPFRMTEENMRAHADSPWIGFWKNLKQGYDSFEATHKVFAVAVCGGHYRYEQVIAGGESGDLTACVPTLAEIREQNDWLNNVPPPSLPRRADARATRD